MSSCRARAGGCLRRSGDLDPRRQFCKRVLSVPIRAGADPVFGRRPGGGGYPGYRIPSE